MALQTNARLPFQSEGIMDLRVKITGFANVDKKLADLEKKVATKVIRQAMRKAAKPVLEAAINNAPVGETGELKKNIKIKAGKRSRYKTTLKVQTGEGDYKGDTFYASFVEFGSESQPAQGFMRRAYDSESEKAKQIAISEIIKGLNNLKK